MKNAIHLSTVLTVLTLGVSVRADILELKNGTVLNGKYAGGTAGTLRFETAAGQQILDASQIIALTFTAPSNIPAASATPVPVATPAATAKTVTVPHGEMLLVRMMDGVSSHNAPGANFTTKLEYDLVVNGVVAIKAGTVIHGKVHSSTQARRLFGQSTLDLRLATIVLGGAPIPIATSGFQQAGEASIKKAARGTVAGAAIGAIAGNAGRGAAIGATASLLKRGQTITVPPGTLLEFTLTQPVTITL